MNVPNVKQLRASVVHGGGGDYHDVEDGHWIDDHVSTPMGCGITELIKISALADAHGALLVPHGSGPYSYHFCCTRHNSPFNEIIMSAPKADKVLPAFNPLLLDEPVPENGRLKMTALDKPGFGAELNPECKLHRPYPR